MADVIQKIDDVTVLDLGQSGENQTKTIKIDMSAWVEQWPDTSMFIVALRAGEIVPYVATTTMENNILSWTVLTVDAAKVGIGYAEVRAVGMNGEVKKSKIIRTVVDRSISDIDSDVDGEIMGFIEKLLSAATVLYRSRLHVVSDEDGNVQLSGGSAEEGGYLLDTGLTERGKAADAKAVGDALEQKADKGSGIYDPLRAWPIGSIYMSEDGTSPEALFGGEWERIEGVFVLASNESYETGSTGGTADVKLVENQIPGGA